MFRGAVFSGHGVVNSNRNARICVA